MKHEKCSERNANRIDNPYDAKTRGMQDQQSKLDPVRCEVAWDKTTLSNYELKYFKFTRIQKCCARVACEAATA